MRSREPRGQDLTGAQNGRGQVPFNHAVQKIPALLKGGKSACKQGADNAAPHPPGALRRMLRRLKSHAHPPQPGRR